MIDLDETQLKTVEDILHRHIPNKTVWAFGSRVKGNAKKYSDLDLVIHSDHKIDWKKLEALKDAFSESDLAISVDIVDWQSIPESFHTIILEKYLVIQSEGSF